MSLVGRLNRHGSAIRCLRSLVTVSGLTGRKAANEGCFLGTNEALPSGLAAFVDGRTLVPHALLLFNNLETVIVLVIYLRVVRLHEAWRSVRVDVFDQRAPRAAVSRFGGQRSSSLLS